MHVSANPFVYYEKGNLRAVVAPDVFVVLEAPGHLRYSYPLWNEPTGPDFVLEVISANTRRDDERRKPGVYASLGVSEYFLYDPTGGTSRHPFRATGCGTPSFGRCLTATMLPSRGVAVHSDVLELEFRDVREERMLRLHVPTTSHDLLTHQESEQTRAEKTDARRQGPAVRRAADACSSSGSSPAGFGERPRADGRAAVPEARPVVRYRSNLMQDNKKMYTCLTKSRGNRRLMKLSPSQA